MLRWADLAISAVVASCVAVGPMAWHGFEQEVCGYPDSATIVGSIFYDAAHCGTCDDRNQTTQCTGTNRIYTTCSIPQICYTTVFSLGGGWVNAGQVPCGQLMAGVCNGLACQPRSQSGPCHPVSTVARQ